MKSNKIALCVMLSTVLFSGYAQAEDDAGIEVEKPLLEEIGTFRQKMQREAAFVQYLEAKKRRMQLELDIETVGDAVPLPVIPDSTSFADVTLMPLSVGAQAIQPPAPPVTPQTWNTVSPYVEEYDEPVKAKPAEVKITLVEVVGFEDNLKAVISVDGRKSTVHGGDVVRGTDIVVVKVHHGFVELKVKGKARLVDFNSGLSEPMSSPEEEPEAAANFMAGDTSFTAGNTFPAIEGM